MTLEKKQTHLRAVPPPVEAIEELLSRSLDESLDESERLRLDQALAESAELRELQADLIQLTRIARETPVPSAPPLSDDLLARVETYGMASPLRRYLMPALAAVAMFAFFLLTNNSPQEPSPELLAQAEQQLDLELFQQHKLRYHASIAEMEALAVERLASMAPQDAFLFSDHLSNVNQAIQTCEQSVEENQDPSIVKTLGQVYEEKVKILDRIIAS